MKKLSSIIALLLLIPYGFAHELWLEPETFFPNPKLKTAVRLYIGDGLVKDREEFPIQLDRIVAFKLSSASGNIDLRPSVAEGAKPVYIFSADREGNYLLAMERNWSYIKIEPQKFEDYLRSDGIEYIIEQRAKLGESTKEGRERYSRFIKTLLQVGDKRDETYQKELGLRLEITPIENPYSKKVGDNLTFKVTFDGKPLAGKTVFADNQNSTVQKMLTDDEGKITMKIAHSGLWLVRLVYMQRCKRNCVQADWESFWGSFSFGVRG